MRGKDIVSVYDLTSEEVWQVLKLAESFKLHQKAGMMDRPLAGKTLAMIFHKPSTRTRVSFEVGIWQLGGYALYLGASDLQLRRGETLADTARTLSRYVDGIMIRTFAHDDVVELARYATVPVINGLTDYLHPCQALTDIFTVAEKRGRLTGLKLVYVGDGNNVANALLHAGAKVGMHVVVATPEGHEPDQRVVAEASQDASRTGGSVELSNRPREAVRDADVIYTDVWASMGQEAEEAQRKRIFQPFQVNQSLLSAARPDVLFMHCLPAHRGDEVTDEVVDGPHSIVFDQAENRLHLQKALMALVM
jgi:ornithine carbamoyltransferase